MITNMELNNIKFRPSNDKRWKKIINEDYKCFYTGSEIFIKDLINNFKLNQLKKIDKNSLAKYLMSYNNDSSLIFFSKNIFLAFTSFCRDYPIFFCKKKNKILISNNIYKILGNDYDIDERSLVEFTAFSYVLEDKTLAQDYYSLGPAEIIYSNKNACDLIRLKYFHYHKTL